MAFIRKDGGKPQIASVRPPAAIAGGEFYVQGTRFRGNGEQRSRVRFGEIDAPLVIGGNDFMIVKVPDGATVGKMVVENGESSSSPFACQLGLPIAENLHPVANPAIDAEGNVFITFSGSRGQKTTISVFKIDLNYNVKPFLKDVMNATGLAVNPEGTLFVTSRYDGRVYQVTPGGKMSIYAEGMGVATGLAFDAEGNLFVGDRSGTIFKIAPGGTGARQIFVFATLEPSISAYHLTVSPDQYLYVTGPTTSSFDSIHRVSPAGQVELFYRGLGRPQGMAFDSRGRLHIAASLGGRKGLLRFGADRQPEQVVSGPGLVGVAFLAGQTAVVATTNTLYRVELPA